MKTIVIYDNTGNIYFQASGDFIEPQGGLQYLIVEIPEGKYIASIDTSKTPHEVIFEDIPKSQEQVLIERVELLENALNEMILG